MSTWITSRRVLLHDPLRLQHASLRVEGTRIVEVLHGPPPPQTPHTDLGDLLLTPAFINAHTHLAMNCFRGFAVDAATDVNVVENLFFHIESLLSPQDIRAFARLGAYESLLHGVGFVWEHYYGGVDLALALTDVGLAGVVAPTLQDLSGPGQRDSDHALLATAQIATSARLQDQGVFAAVGPHATDTVSPELWAQALQLAAQHQLPLHAHVAQSLQEFERSIERHGRSPVAQLDHLGALDHPLPFLLIHALFVSRSDLSLLDPDRHALGFCPYSQLIFGFPAPVHAWQDAGIPWFLATDCAASNDSMNVQKEMRFVAGLRTMPTPHTSPAHQFLERPDLSNARALQSQRDRSHQTRDVYSLPEFLLPLTTSTPGRLHPGAPVGRIAPGHLANLITWDTSHPSFWPGTQPLRSLALADTSMAIHQMMVAGRWLAPAGEHHRGLLQTPEYRDALQEAQARFDSLTSRAGL